MKSLFTPFEKALQALETIQACAKLAIDEIRRPIKPVEREAVLGKEGDASCHTTKINISASKASPAAKVTNAAQLLIEENDRHVDAVLSIYNLLPEPKTVEPDVKESNEHCLICGIKTFKGSVSARWPVIIDFPGGHAKTYCVGCANERLGQPPHWLPVSQCDLKPGEGFWYKTNYKIDLIPAASPVDAIIFFKNDSDITHYLRAIPPYAIPKPPVKVEDDEFIKFVNTHFSGACKPDRDLLLAGWNARASLQSKGGDGK